MGIGGALMQDPRFRKQIMEQNGGQNPVGPLKRKQNLGLMAIYGGPEASQRMNEALRVRRSQVSPSQARNMNRKGG